MKKEGINYEAPVLTEEQVSTEYGFAGSGFGGVNEAGDTVRENEDYIYSL